MGLLSSTLAWPFRAVGRCLVPSIYQSDDQKHEEQTLKEHVEKVKAFIAQVQETRIQPKQLQLDEINQKLTEINNKLATIKTRCDNRGKVEPKDVADTSKLIGECKALASEKEKIEKRLKKWRSRIEREEDKLDCIEDLMLAKGTQLNDGAIPAGETLSKIEAQNRALRSAGARLTEIEQDERLESLADDVQNAQFEKALQKEQDSLMPQTSFAVSSVVGGVEGRYAEAMAFLRGSDHRYERVDTASTAGPAGGDGGEAVLNRRNASQARTRDEESSFSLESVYEVETDRLILGDGD